MFGITRLKHFKKSGARIYIPQSLLLSPSFPFADDDLVKIELGKNGVVVLSRPEWWEMLDWETMSKTYEMLPQEIKDKIRGSKESANNG